MSANLRLLVLIAMMFTALLVAIKRAIPLVSRFPTLECGSREGHIGRRTILQ